MSGYDAWLERPYQDAAAAGDAYVDWCESQDLDPDGDHWDAFEDARADALEDAAIEAAERRAEYRAEMMADRDVW